MNYNTNDAINILFRCGIQTIPALLKHLEKGGFEIAERTLKKKVSILRQGSMIEDERKNNSRPPYFCDQNLKKLKTAITKTPEASAPNLVKKAKLSCCPKTVSRELRKEGFKYLRVKTVPYMTSGHQDKRIEFATNHINDRLWRRTFFLDEASFQAYSHKEFCYQKPNERITRARPKHPPKIHVIAMISYRGPTRLIVFTDIMTGTRFAGFLDLLSKDAKDLYPDGHFRVYFDKDSKHTSNPAKASIAENHLNVPNDWPPSSPDINPIENVWGRVESEVQKLYPQTIEQLTKAIKTIWRNVITRDYCETLVNSMRNRMQQLLDRGGRKISY